jgi:hypothetical protein
MTARKLALLLVFIAPSLRAQSILPQHFGNWTASGASQKAPQLVEAAEIFRESGLDGSEARSYSNGVTTANVRLYLLHDSSGAYEVYTYFLKSADDTGRGSTDAPDERVSQIGNIVLVAEKSAALNASDLETLTKQVKVKADSTPPPPIPNYLPERDRIAGTEKYALGPGAFRDALAKLNRAEYAAIAGEVGFTTGAEAMLARYRAAHDDAVLLLIEFPTPQMAGLHWKHLEQALPGSAKEKGTTIERKGSLLAIVLAPTSETYATRVREAVRYETQVTWNEPTHAITDPPITTVLAKIIIATGVFMLVAIVFGVAFGGVRVLLKKLLPGKVFDRPEQMDVLQLGLSGKRINSRDFY